jgi:hypothetical protein
MAADVTPMTKQRFLSKVRASGEGRECWTWTGWHDRKGYAGCNLGRASTRAARVSYELFVGRIPEGLTIDHLCRNVACVNPDHLEPVTRSENVRRAHAAKTHCKHGHPLSGENVYYRPDAPKIRQCKECQRQHVREYRARQAVAA